MKKISVLLSVALLVGHCDWTMCAEEKFVDVGASAENLLLLTVADAGARSLQRGYHRAGYRASNAAAVTMADIEREYALHQVDSWPIPLLGVYCVLVTPAANVSRQAALAQLQRDARVSLAQPMQTFTMKGSDNKNSDAKNNGEKSRRGKGYNDPYFSLQYGKYAPRIEQLHQRVTGRGVRVAIVDTGADRTHPDLNGHISISHNFAHTGNVELDKELGVDKQFDSDIHGTAVAGIIVAAANNQIGIVGLAPDAEVLMLKACWQLKADEIAARCNSFTLAKALSFAIEQHVDVINLSLAGPADPLLEQLLKIALGRGILIVAARDPLGQFPADMPGVIAVDAAAGLSSHTVARTVAVRGGIFGDAPRLIVEAEASELLSTSPNGRYDYFSGSSMAAARVTGFSALMRQQQRTLSAMQLLKNFNQWLNSPPTVAQFP